MMAMGDVLQRVLGSLRTRRLCCLLFGVCCALLLPCATQAQLVGYYSLEGTAQDASGNGHHGSVQGAVTYDRGRVCDGLLLDGSGYLLVPDHAALDLPDELTVMAWVRPDTLSVSDHDPLYSVLSKDTNSEFHVRNDGAIYWWWGSGSLITAPGLVRPGVWQHIAFTYSRAAGSMRIYLDGRIVLAQAYSAALPVNNDPFYIGTDIATGGGEMAGRRFYGAIDEVRIYSTALDQRRIVELMAAADPCILPTPRAEWRFDECSYAGLGALANDTQGRHDAVAQGGVSSEAVGVVGRAAELDRSSESFTTGSDVPMTGDWTVSTWFRLPFAVAEGSRYHVLGAMAGGNDLLWLDNRDRFRWGGYANGRTVNGSFLFNSLNDGWHHLVLVGEGGSTRLYIDGSYRDQVALQPQGNLHFVGTSYDNYLGSQGFRAPLDEFIVFDQGLDPQQIDTLYQLQNQGRNLDGSLRAEIFCGTTIDHFQIIHDGSALTCAAEAVTVRACTNADCSTLYGDPVTIRLSPSGWVGGDEQILTGGSGTFRLRHTTPGAVTLGVSGNPAADHPFQCINNGGNVPCALMFHQAGFLFEVPDHRACRGQAGITIAAVRADATAEQCVGDPGFAGTTRPVHFWFNYQQPATGTQSLRVNASAVGTAAPGTPITVAFDGQAASSLSVQYNDAGRLQLSAYFAGSGEEAGLVMSGSDSFVVAPESLRVMATSDGSAALNNATFSGEPHWPAGENFHVEVAGVCSDGTLTENFAAATTLYADTPYAPVTGTMGSLSGGSLAAGDYVSGRAEVDDVAYSEVGTLTLAAEVPAYLGSALAVTGSSAPVGRFTPHHFGVSLNTPQLATGCAFGGFTCLGQPFDYLMAPVITVTARNLQNQTTENYAGDWWKLSAGTLSGKSYSAAVGVVDTSRLPASDPMVAELGGGMGLLTFGSGGGLVMDRGAPTAPFDAEISLEINVLDGDGIAAAANPVRFGLPLTGGGMAFDAGKEMRWGRLLLHNAYGSELLALAMPLRTEYFDGSRFVFSSGDSCTRLPLSQLSLSNGSGTVTADNPVAIGSGTTRATLVDPFVLGDANLSFSPPGDEGYVDVTADLGLLDWLRYDWNGDGSHDNNPQGRATFGIYKGRPNLIYRRETFR